MQFLPILVWLRTMTPIPMSELSPTVHPCSMAMCPTVTFSPIVHGTPSSAWADAIAIESMKMMRRWPVRTFVTAGPQEATNAFKDAKYNCAKGDFAHIIALGALRATNHLDVTGDGELVAQSAALAHTCVHDRVVLNVGVLAYGDGGGVAAQRG